MSDVYKLQYNSMTLAFPGWNGYVGYDAPSFYTLTLETDGHGTLSAETLTGHAGDTVILSPTYNTYFRFSSYDCTGGTIEGNTFTFGNQNATAKVNFQLNSFTAKGTMYWINQFTGSYQGARDAYPELRITGWTGASPSSTMTGGIGTSYGATGTSKAGNFTGHRGWKDIGTYSSTSLKKPVNCSAWRISAGIDVGGQHNQGAGYGYEDGARVLTASVGIDGTGTAKTNSVNNGWFPSNSQGTRTGHFNVTATASQLGAATNPGSYVPYVVAYNYGGITQGSGGFYSWAHNRITSFSGPWTASGIMP